MIPTADDAQDVTHDAFMAITAEATVTYDIPTYDGDRYHKIVTDDGLRMVAIGDETDDTGAYCGVTWSTYVWDAGLDDWDIYDDCQWAPAGTEDEAVEAIARFIDQDN